LISFCLPEHMPAYWREVITVAGLWLAGLLVFVPAWYRFKHAWRKQADSLDKFIVKSGYLEQAIVEQTGSLQSQQRRIQSFLNNLEVGAYLKNERHDFTMVNPRLCAILGVTSADILGSTGYNFMPQVIAWHMTEMEQKVLHEGRAMEIYDLVESTVHNDRRVYNLHVFPVFNPKGDIEGTGGMIIDVTERHRLSQAILEAKTAAEKANMAKSNFLANISHEVRTPLNGILGMADLLLRSQLSRDQLTMVGTIKNAGHSLLLVLNDILDISKIEAGKMNLETLTFDLRELVFESTTSLASMTENKPLELMINISPEIPEHLAGDPIRLRQIMLNLVSNALKFTPKGEVVITVEILEKSVPTAGLELPPSAEPLPPPQEAVKLRFSVADTGVGIPLEKRQIIFQPFEQADASTTRTHGGTGLGLAICHRLLTMMGSRLELSSQVNAGSTFWFDLVLPVSIGEKAPMLSRLNLVQLAGRSILLVDDNANNRYFLMEELKSLGLHTMEAAGADEALRYLKLTSSHGQPFDLVITDNIMPEKNGLDLLKEMRAEPLCRSIPAILLTSTDIHDIPIGQGLISFAAVLTKPVRPPELVAAIASALNVAGPPDKAEADKPRRPAVSFRILIVEDVEMNQVVATRLLEELGHRVAVAGGGAQALAILGERDAKTRFDLVLMDIQMPGMDGLETTAELRRLEAENNWPPLPVVAMTANAMKGDREKYLAAGLDDCLTKPVTMNDLVGLLDRLAAKAPNQALPLPGPVYEAEAAPGGPPENKTPGAGTTTDEPVMDEKVMKLSFGNNQILLEKSMEIFLRDAPNLMSGLQAAIKADDFKQTAALAHALKGISSYFTRGGPFELARLLDLEAQKDPSPEMKAELNGLSTALDRAVATLTEAMNERLRGAHQGGTAVQPPAARI